MLAVVFVTNEDDGSAPPTTKIFEDDGGAHGAYDTYRQTRYGIACGNPLAPPPYGDSHGPLADCAPAPDVPGNRVGEEYDVGRYITLFTQPKTKQQAGLKRDPLNDVILVGLEGTLAAPQIILAKASSGSGVGPEPAYVPCATADDRDLPGAPAALVSERGATGLLRRSAAAAARRARGHQQPRRSEHLRRGPESQRPTSPRCSSRSRSGSASASRLACIPALLSDSEHPDCVVEDVTSDDNGSHITRNSALRSGDGRVSLLARRRQGACKEALTAVARRQSSIATACAAPLDTTLHVFCSTLAN